MGPVVARKERRRWVTGRMIVLDTNVVSEIVKAEPHPSVVSWWSAHDSQSYFITTVTVAELLQGVNNSPAGRKSDELAEMVLEAIDFFGERVLEFDMIAATECANLRSLRAGQGRPISVPDAMIAATAVAAEADAIATRDRGLHSVGIPVVDPWAA